MYKIMKKVSSSGSTVTNTYWEFVRVDSTSQTDFTAATQDELEIKLKLLLAETPSTNLQVVTPSDFNIDILFS